ncbi:MAG TPA: 50S ribosomal protein L11 methyltransferase [Nevskiaceae bacterium]|nr:50S ribosomal protein L11 methyltransferase [Nevskiaceae bacterium]
MAWLQLMVRSAHPEFADEILQAQGAQAVSFIDAQDDPVLEPAPGATPLWSHTLTLGLFAEHTDLAPVLATLRELLPDGSQAQFTHELIEDQDWVRVWLKDCPPLKFGERLWVVPREKRAEVTQADAIILELDPGLAFGTGTHPTTALCLDWLARQDLAGKSLLDYGCGSGILAIAALKLGAQRAVAVDIDPQALIAARDNAAVNGVEGALTTLASDDFIPFAADVVVANILANPLIALAPLLASSSRPGGALALAGLLDRQAEEVRAAYEPWFEFQPDRSKDGWTLLSAQCEAAAIVNYLEISPALGTGGQPRPEHFAQLKRDGYDAVINLSVATSPNALPDEGALCAQQGLHYTHIPVEWDKPARADLEKFFSTMRTHHDRRVFVHCVMNKRVSAFVYLHRVLNQGADAHAARHQLHRIWQPNAVWQRYIDDMLRTSAE